MNGNLDSFAIPKTWILKLISSYILGLTLSLPDQICHSPACKLYNSYYVSSENLILDQLIIEIDFFLILISYLVDIVLIL